VTIEDAPAPTIRVEVVYALPEKYWTTRLVLADGATVARALAAANLASQQAGIEIDPARMAVFSRPVTLSTVLRDGDRLELLRPLTIDPKQGRRSRAKETSPKKKL
jgi:putative ubiquitin-RnfH superfamily antitoxin RatB of RatAB toxin-antitoxin module